MTAFNLSPAARSRMATSSDFCCAVVRPGLDGQQELPTVAIHAARNSRAGGGGTILSVEKVSSAANRIAGSSKAVTRMELIRFMPSGNETWQTSFWQLFSAKRPVYGGLD